MANAEKVISEWGVLDEFDEIIGGNYEIVKSCENENGIYILEVRTTDESGDIVQYNYIRKGSYPEGSSTDTVIDVIFFMGDIPVGGHPVKKYKEGVWVPEVD